MCPRVPTCVHLADVHLPPSQAHDDLYHVLEKTAPSVDLATGSSPIHIDTVLWWLQTTKPLTAS